MTALVSSDHFHLALPVTALERAQDATLDYCATTAKEQAHAKLRDMSALETMYAYFGSDEA
ncbi:hypothetical protein EEB11_06535 [Pseudotabrizicola sediminis]|uniref:Uncharacterized protein n=1 Tax=Pseudotabrizicola sediminis TaxID=2486418 RepID=A0ABY2KRZ4_9RHOB|nr:hypothetical protein [Pseudotabrizicola sediminis]TGD44331.1 hypothetical protein EEB11_06535 [Pseudotabrizicola sediminis]TGD64573.1 hypothetical protein EYC08_09860 [Tabrizicola sp. WMC-M-20]